MNKLVSYGYLLIISTCLSVTSASYALAENNINYSIIVAGQRENSQSQKVAKYIEDQLKAKGKTVSVIDLYKEKLPLWEEPSEKNMPLSYKIWNESIAPKLAKADALIIVTPEYNGAASPAIKNFFLFPRGEIAHKPALLVGVSAGMGGAYPLAELRANSTKDTFIVYMPGNVVIREVKDKLNESDAKSIAKIDGEIRDRLDYSLNVLEQYGLALKMVRASNVIDMKKYPMGQ